jgi:hypothetical protein
MVVVECEECEAPFMYLLRNDTTESVATRQCSLCGCVQRSLRDPLAPAQCNLVSAGVNEPRAYWAEVDRQLPDDGVAVSVMLQFYVDKSSARRQTELDEALARNLANRHVSRLYVLLEREADRKRVLDIVARCERDPLHHCAKVLLCDDSIGRRLTYKAAIEFARAAGQQRSDVFVLLNSDCYMDHTLAYVRSHPFARYVQEQRPVFYALSRHDVDAQTPHVLRYNEAFAKLSQDAWLFMPSTIPDTFANAVDFALGKPGCDNRVVYEAQRHLAESHHIANPSLRIVCRHLHASQVRHYNASSDKIDGPYAYLPPTFALFPSNESDSS